ncbi:MAG TPA: gamma-glutamyltransferase [Acidimicrobiales bacterium]|nr:gamma-glutamyltransferase [Acidimicrobiales bacterium]
MPLAPLPDRQAPRGMVCAVDHLAAAAGAEVLHAGGNAVDAAVAANAVTAVTTQHQCGMGGDLFALVHLPGEPSPAALCASGRSGSGADADGLRAEGHTRMPPTGDIRTVPVPGCVDGWVALHQRFGRLPLADLFAPARSYAADGFPASEELALAVAAFRLAADDYRHVEQGRLVRRPGVARALDAVARHGRAGFYGGEFGEGLLALGRGHYTEDDLARSQATWVEPLVVEAWGRRIWTVPPPSQGYVTLSSAWIAHGLPVPDDPAEPLWAHLLVEAARQAGYDRPAVLHEHADGRALLAPERLLPRRAAVDPERAAVLGGAYADSGTTYLCAVDEDRMGVSLIQSNASGFGSLLVEPDTGIPLQNRGIGFSLEPGHPAEYGPARRPPHTLAPALVTHPDGRLDAVLGTMGGDAQPQIVLQLLARLLLAGQSPTEAVAAPRWTFAGSFDTWDAGGAVEVRVEAHAPTAWVEGLASRGHRVEQAQAFSHPFGHAHVVRVDGDVLEGAADPRARCSAAVGF